MDGKETVKEPNPPKSPRRFHPGTKTAIVVAALFVIATVIAVVAKIPVRNVMENYNYDVIVLLIVMELFIKLIEKTGIMEFLAIKLAVMSDVKKRLCFVYFGAMMFFISALLNNITAVMMILPVVFVFLRAIKIDQKYINIFFAILLALSNTGGAASPIGDFPAVVIMTSGITDFRGYLGHAFPLFLVTSAVLLLFWILIAGKQKDNQRSRQLAISFLQSRYKYHRVRWKMLIALGVILLGMFLTWSFVPQDVLPPEMVAVLGYVCAAAMCALKGIKLHQHVDMKSVLPIASFLYMATVVSQSGALDKIANYLQGQIQDPLLLLIAIMVVTALCAGIFSAGPAAAAMMPVIVTLCNTTFQGNGSFVAIAYAASICAGSSLFMSSATAGFILSDHINHADLSDGEGRHLTWNIGNYLPYGIANFFLQMLVAIAWVSVSFVILY